MPCTQIALLRAASTFSQLPNTQVPTTLTLPTFPSPPTSIQSPSGMTLILIIVQFAKINVIASVSYFLAAIVVGCFLYSNVAKFTSRPPLPLPDLLKNGISEAEVRAHADRVAGVLNMALGYGYRLGTGREPALTGAVAGTLYFTARLASTFSLLGLTYAAVLTAFTVPKVYEMKKDEIDGAIDQARSQATSVYDKYMRSVVNRIPRAAAAKPAESSSQKKEE
jgi:hypothetical protein